MNALFERYRHLYDKMKHSQDPAKMKIFGKAEKHIFEELSEHHPDIAQKWVDRLEAVCWGNYLSHDEAEAIAQHMVAQDGTKGMHWPYETFTMAMRTHGLEVEEKPYYNSYALWVVMNMIWSDHAKSIAEDMGYKSVSDVPADRMVKSCYRKAIEKLRDPDREDFVRDYFRHAM